MEDVEKLFVRRQDWPRVAIDKLVEETQLLLRHGAETAPRAEIVNLSRSGAGILTAARLAKGTQVKLEMRGNTIPKLDFDAEVRWAANSPVSTGQYPAGLKFVNLDQHSQTKLRELFELMKKHRPPQ